MRDPLLGNSTVCEATFPESGAVGVEGVAAKRRRVSVEQIFALLKQGGRAMAVSDMMCAGTLAGIMLFATPPMRLKNSAIMSGRVAKIIVDTILTL